LPDGEDWLMRPIIKGLCRYESLLDGKLTLADFALMNDALDVVEENDRRYSEVTNG
jgi:hypothetical protein